MITWLAPDDPPDRFPPHEAALRDPSGLLAAGGDLRPERLMAAYARGIFPWYSPGQPVLWWSPDPREVLWPSEFHRSRSLTRALRRRGFSLHEDRDFGAVVSACAAPRSRSPGTWITPEMKAAYCLLHARGWARCSSVNRCSAAKRTLPRPRWPAWWRAAKRSVSSSSTASCLRHTCAASAAGRSRAVSFSPF